MRAINLIPPEERRGLGAPTRTGRAPHVALGLLALAIAAFGLMVQTNGSISDRQAEVAQLEQQQLDAEARAEALRPFATFAAARQARESTIASLARSRFDWERVMAELSRVIPSDIWLTELTATASPDISIEGATSNSLRSETTGPALELVGCGRSHEAVAGLIAAMEDIDGVTRVTATNSSKAEVDETTGSAAGSAAGGGSDCQTRPSVATFELIVAFDAVPAPELPADAGAAAAVAGAPAPVASSPESSPAATSTDSTTPVTEATP